MRASASVPPGTLLHCSVANISSFLKTLSCLSLGNRETWTTFAFTPTVIVAHTSTDDHCSTATARLPVSLFSDYNLFLQDPNGGASPDVRFMVNVALLIDALTLGGNTPLLAGNNFMTIALTYPARDGQLQVVVRDDVHTASSYIVTRSVKDRLLDLRFSDALVSNKVTIRSDIAREAIADIIAFQAEQTILHFGPSAISWYGRSSQFGGVKIDVSCRANDRSEIARNYEVGDSKARFCYSTFRLAVALGLAPASSKRSQMQQLTNSGPGGGGSSGLTQQQQLLPPGSSGGATFSQMDLFFDHMTLQVNTEKQLCVVHQSSSSQDSGISVSIVVCPLAHSALSLDDGLFD